VEATDNGAGQDYIQTASLADQPLDRAWLQHHEIADGGTLRLAMGPEPNKQWATAKEARPPQN
jgi:putative alpha-1,2-mannosidase